MRKAKNEREADRAAKSTIERLMYEPPKSDDEKKSTQPAPGKFRDPASLF